MKRILTFDGGGVRGLFSLVILERLISEQHNLLKDVDLYAGTSTGGIIALGLADNIKPATLRRMYESEGKKIFKRNWWYPFGARRAKYVNKGLAKVLDAVFGRCKLGEMHGKVLVPAFSLCGEQAGKPMWKPKFFNNWRDEDPDCELLVKDVAMATSAAPTFFPAYKGYVDGGVIANNPCAAAMAMMLNPDELGYNISRRELRLLSIGTGSASEAINEPDANWGLIQWGSHIIDVFMEGVDEVPTYMCKSILQDNFCRVNAVYAKDKLPALDAWDKADKLVAMAEAVDLTGPIKWIGERWN